MYLPLFSVVNAGSVAAVQAAAPNPVPQGDGNSMPFALIFFMNITTLTGTSPTIQLVLEAFDDLSQTFVQWGTVFVAAAATGMFCYVVGSTGVGAAAGGVTATVNLPVPSKWRARIVPGGTITAASFTVSAYTVPLTN